MEDLRHDVDYIISGAPTRDASVRVNQGSSDVITREFLDSLLIEFSHLDAVVPSTKCTLFGETLPSPVMAGAVSKYERFNEGGGELFAEGVRKADSVMWVGIMSDEEMKPIIEKGTRVIRIIKPFADRDKVCRMIESSEALGCIAVGMDIDHALKKDGTISVLSGDRPLDIPTTEDIRLYSGTANIPFIAKGILSVRDAVKCVAAGADALVVSHHQNLFPWAVPPLNVLPDIVKAIKSEVPVLADCGLYSGFDVFKALALGASATCVVRPLLSAFHKNGSSGVSDLLGKITGELRGTMARTGSQDLEHIDKSVLRKRGR